MSQFKERLCGCGCGRKFTPTRTWGQYAFPKCRWEAWILKKAAEIKKLRRAAKVAAAVALLFFVGGCSDLAHATVNMEAIKQIESAGNPKAHNKRTNARGLYQITPICLAHYREETGFYFTMDDMFDPKKNEIVAAWYFGWLERQGLDDVEQIIAFNWGIGNLRKYQRDSEKEPRCWGKMESDGSTSMACADPIELPKETQDYLTKYQAITADGGK